jgi:arginase family enzyme
MTSREAIELVRGIANSGLAGVDVVEASPSLEGHTSSSTALIAGRVALEPMAFSAGARRAQAPAMNARVSSGSLAHQV